MSELVCEWHLPDYREARLLKKIGENKIYIVLPKIAKNCVVFFVAIVQVPVISSRIWPEVVRARVGGCLVLA